MFGLIWWQGWEGMGNSRDPPRKPRAHYGMGMTSQFLILPYSMRRLHQPPIPPFWVPYEFHRFLQHLSHPLFVAHETTTSHHHHGKSQPSTPIDKQISAVELCTNNLACVKLFTSCGIRRVPKIMHMFLSLWCILIGKSGINLKNEVDNFFFWIHVTMYLNNLCINLMEEKSWVCLATTDTHLCHVLSQQLSFVFRFRSEHAWQRCAIALSICISLDLTAVRANWDPTAHVVVIW